MRHLNTAGRGVLALLPVLVVQVACQKSIYRDYRIPTTSMEPTFAQYQRVTVRRLAADAELRRGDIVVFLHPNDEHKRYMKRTVALAGDTVRLAGETLFVNGMRQEEPFAQYTRKVAAFGPVTVSPASVFVLGDNRAQSLDSRHFGSVPRTHVVGIVRH